MSQVSEQVDDNNCQADMQLDGMLTGASTLPPKLARTMQAQEQQAGRSQFAQALADALRKTDTEETK